MPTLSKISRRTRKLRRHKVTDVMSVLGKPRDGGTATILGIEYKIYEGADARLNDIDIRGAVHTFPAVIVLDDAMGRDQQELTLLHEVVHAVDDALDIDLSEEQVGRLTAGLYSVCYKGPRKRDKTRTIRGLFYG